jgi:competence protein ComEA
MKTWWWLVLGVLFGLLSAGVILIASSPPRGAAIVLLPPPTPLPMQIHVTGAVQRPGLYFLPQESRVRDAIEAAGGFSEDASYNAVNLAAFLEDGTQLLVPVLNQAVNSSDVIKSPPDSYQPAVQQSFTIININSASQAELETLPNIGPVTAQKIIAFREEFGDFAMIEEIQKVSGIGSLTFESIEAYITVGN